MSDDAREAILGVLFDHKEIIAGSGRYGVFSDKAAIWQKALNVAIEQGVKFDSHTKLMRRVRQWKSQAECNQADGLMLAPWENLLLSIFDAHDSSVNIKKELMEDEDWQEGGRRGDLWSQQKDSSFQITVQDETKLLIAKTMLRHKDLITNARPEEQDSGWRKVYRVAHANGAYYDSITTMRQVIRHWKTRAMSRLIKDPGSITQLDKYMFTMYDIDTGSLDLNDIKPSATQLDFSTNPGGKLTHNSKMGLLQEMLRNKKSIFGDNHLDKYYGWSNVLRVANNMGGEFDNIFLLTAYIKYQLKIPAERKLRLREKTNEIDQLVFKIYDLDGSGLEFQREQFTDMPANPSHQCKLCHVTYHRFDELRVHQQMLHGQMPESDIGRKCRICGIDVGDKPAIRVHLRDFHPTEPFQCDLCEQMFMADDDLNAHVRTHVEYNPAETLEAVSESEDEIASPDKSALEAAKRGESSGRGRKRGTYRKRVKIEVATPDEGVEVPRLGKKEGGLCPHCGEVSFF